VKYSEMTSAAFLQAAEDYAEAEGALAEFIVQYRYYRAFCNVKDSTLLALNDVFGRECPLIH
jgi:hypothetical protein